MKQIISLFIGQASWQSSSFWMALLNGLLPVSSVFWSLLPLRNFVFIIICYPHLMYPFPLSRTIPLCLTLPRPQCRSPKCKLFYGDKFVGLLLSPQHGWPVRRIYNRRGRVAQLYAQEPGTHFGRLLRPAWAAVGLFCSPITTRGV